MSDKYIWKISFVFFALVSVLLFVLWMNGIVFNMVTYGDFHNQHMFYMEYFQKNFELTKEILPNLNMNFGMFQNYANYYYYGVFNVFVRGYSLFSFLTVYQYQVLVNALCYTIIFHFMIRILNSLNFSYKYILFGSLLTTFASGYMWYGSVHTMLAYPYVFFIITLYGLLELVRKNKIGLFTLGNILILSSNLFIIQATGLFLIILFIYCVYSFDLKKEDIMRLLKKIMLSYIIALGSCAVIIVPQLYLFLNKSRYILNEEAFSGFMHLRGLSSVVSYYLKFGFGVFTFFLLVSLPIIKKKYVVVPTLVLLLFFISEDINYVFNLFALQDKIYMFAAPITVILILSAFLEMKKTSVNKRFLVILSSIVLYTLAIIIIDDISIFDGYYENNEKYMFSRNVIFVLTTCISFILLFVLLFKIKCKKVIIYSLMIIFFATNIYVNGIFVDKKLIEENMYLHKYKDSESMEISLNREDYIRKSNNYRIDITKNYVYNYTSFVNTYYNNYFSDIVEVPIWSSGLAIHKYDSSCIIDKVLSLNSYCMSKPFIYGSYEVLDYDSWSKLDKKFRLIASMEAPTINGEFNGEIKNPEFFEKLELVEKHDVIDVQQEEIFHLENLQKSDGEYIIIANPDTDEEVSVTINKSKNSKSASSYRYYNNNEQFVFYVPATENGVTISTTIDVTLKNVEIYYISANDINELENDYVTPKNVVFDINDSVEFDIVMKQEGILATTIPFDNGYIILVDGKEVDIELVDDAFIGTNLSIGEHKVKIIYKTPGKNIGIVISFVFVLFLIINLYLEEKNEKNLCNATML